MKTHIPGAQGTDGERLREPSVSVRLRIRADSVRTIELKS
jgi:hypothetical protein